MCIMEFKLYAFVMLTVYIQNSWTIVNEPSYWNYIKNEIYTDNNKSITLEEACHADDSSAALKIYFTTQKRVFKNLFVLIFYCTLVAFKDEKNSQNKVFDMIKTSFNQIHSFMIKKRIGTVELEDLESIITGIDKKITKSKRNILEIFISIVQVVKNELGEKTKISYESRKEINSYEEIIRQKYNWNLYRSVIPESVKTSCYLNKNVSYNELLNVADNIYNSIKKEYNLIHHPSSNP
ncbi:uncharacterized protein LOC126907488 [Daktulosphaira vitifoliae]|uniref:uncharacterized protein LOC126907488 n=1 Tax=Daktulosphaira vitifoliae TaxID=58002 RepID=UPI0021AA53FC|nr:uncharacterized protein LOC126907488 [Daktulosphaira vitifoliae]XP_050544774.1 uncharacterized protein LOC126907488 [Daktulosphaira vitifoliae]XP_050544775.1 uncharacterized protein LOC126907488 [Daktulosphaira vitifoliae]